MLGVCFFNLSELLNFLNNGDLSYAFMDVAKAFDSVKHQRILRSWQSEAFRGRSQWQAKFFNSFPNVFLNGVENHLYEESVLSYAAYAD